MKRVRSGIPMGIALAAITFGAGTAGASQLNLVPILQISGQYSDNVFFAPEAEKQSDTFFLVNPGLALDYASRNFVSSVSYQVGIQRFQDFDQRDNDVHRADASLGFNLSKGWFLEAADNLYITSDPLAFDASGDRIQRDSFTYNRFMAGLSHTFGSRDVRVEARYDRVDVDYDTLVDSYQNGFGANVSAKVGARSTVLVDYFEFQRNFQEQHPEFNIIDYRGRRYGLRLDRKFSARLSGNVYAGYEDRRFEQQGDLRDYESAIFEAGLNGELPGAFSWSLSGSQRLNDLAIRGAYKVRRANLDLRKSVAERLRLEASGYLQNSKNSQIGEEADYLGMRIEGQYLVAKFLNLWLGYEYLDRQSNQLNDFKENRVNFGLTLSYGL